MKTYMRLVTANDATLFEERLTRLLATLPIDVSVAEVSFDTCGGPGGAVQYSALLRLQEVAS